MDDSDRPDTSGTSETPPTRDGDDDGGIATVTVRHGDGETTLVAERGVNLRRLLLEHGLSPYTRVTERLNCGGRGLCATCGVRFDDPPEPTHWHDRLAARFGYPRLSCQITVEEDTTVELVEDKRIWGGRE
jgi:ferredoxin